MANTISIGQLRQNPTAMLRDVRAGNPYQITDRGVPIANITPHTPRHHPPTMEELNALLEELGPDNQWAQEIRQDRQVYRMRDPWEARQ